MLFANELLGSKVLIRIFPILFVSFLVTLCYFLPFCRVITVVIFKEGKCVVKDLYLSC